MVADLSSLIQRVEALPAADINWVAWETGVMAVATLIIAVAAVAQWLVSRRIAKVTEAQARVSASLLELQKTMEAIRTRVEVGCRLQTRPIYLGETAVHVILTNLSDLGVEIRAAQFEVATDEANRQLGSFFDINTVLKPYCETEPILVDPKLKQAVQHIDFSDSAKRVYVRLHAWFGSIANPDKAGEFTTDWYGLARGKLGFELTGPHGQLFPFK